MFAKWFPSVSVNFRLGVVSVMFTSLDVTVPAMSMPVAVVDSLTALS